MKSVIVNIPAMKRTAHYELWRTYHPEIALWDKCGKRCAGAHWDSSKAFIAPRRTIGRQVTGIMSAHCVMPFEKKRQFLVSVENDVVPWCIVQPQKNIQFSIFFYDLSVYGFLFSWGFHEGGESSNQALLFKRKSRLLTHKALLLRVPQRRRSHAIGHQRKECFLNLSSNSWI